MFTLHIAAALALTGMTQTPTDSNAVDEVTPTTATTDEALPLVRYGTEAIEGGWNAR